MSAAYTLTDHACRQCFGRVLRSAKAPTTYRCANCGLQEPARRGMEYPPICACGTRIGGRDAGIRCEVVEPTPECMSEIVVREI